MSEEKYNPPFTLTDNIIELVSEISECIGAVSSSQDLNSNPILRKSNQIKTIHSSLVIENNTLSLKQVSDIIDGRRVLGPPQDIQEVKNAFEAYEILLQFNPYSEKDLLQAHRILMQGLVPEVGVFRNGSVGIYKGNNLIHVAPPASLVPNLVSDLLHWTKKSNTHPLIKSCVFHYEFEFIHPFSDGNGRMGRMWNTLLLYQWKPIFAWLPVETLIQQRQDEYYRSLSTSDQESSATVFIEFLLTVIRDTLKDISISQNIVSDTNIYVRLLLEKLGDDILSTTQIMERLGLKNRSSFRKTYLVPALEANLISMEFPDKPNSSKQRYLKSF